MANYRRSVLIVEDEEIIRTTLHEFLESEGYDVASAGTIAQALQLVRARDFQIAICDVQLPDGDGVALLKRLQQLQSHLFVLIITAYATVENAVEAFKSGAFDYLCKPVIFEDLAFRLQRLLQYREVYQENMALRRELSRHVQFDQLVGSSQTLQAVQAEICKVATTNCDVLLEGETGTGKELFARAIHKGGPRGGEKFLAVNCGANTADALEAQLFGVRRGQGTPQEQDQPGIFALAGEGTVFLDDVAQLPLGTQAKLLRVIEYNEILPLGSADPLRVNPRIIASTTKDLLREVTEERFHEDLYYRLNGVKIRIPPLRERLDDLPELVEHFLAKHTQAIGKKVIGVSSDTMRLLMSARWKGNVRQLDNALQRAVIMCDSDRIEPNDLPSDLLGIEAPLPATDDLRSALRHYERLHIRRVLQQWPDKREAAKRLRLGLSSLYRKIEELGIDL